MKLKVMKAKPQITDEEIQRYMDFDGLIEKHKSTASFFTKWKIISLLAVTAIVATIAYLWVDNHESSTKATNQRENQIRDNQIQNQALNSNPGNSDSKILITKDSLSLEKVGSKTEKQKTKQIQTSPAVTDRKIESETATALPEKDIFVEAEPIDGFPKLYNFLNQNLKYPESNLKDKIEGVEIISFVIDENGNMSNPKVVQSLGKSFDEEGMRLINAMPKWKAATLNGRPVPSRLSVPFTFSVSKISN